MDNRISDLKTMVTHHPLVAGLAREVPLGAALLDDLEKRGPTCDVWAPLTDGQPRPWTPIWPNVAALQLHPQPLKFAHANT
ncbi:hypothetical protein ACWET9_44440 [Streptomyces sp. NPDC004059]